MDTNTTAANNHRIHVDIDTVEETILDVKDIEMDSPFYLSDESPIEMIVDVDCDAGNLSSSATCPKKAKARTKRVALMKVLLGCGTASSVIAAVKKGLVVGSNTTTIHSHSTPSKSDDDAKKEKASIGIGIGLGSSNQVVPSDYDFFMKETVKGIPPKPESARSLQATYDFTYVGVGTCWGTVKFSNAYGEVRWRHDSVSFLNVADADACRNKCLECPGQGQYGNRELRGFEYENGCDDCGNLSAGKCTCLLESGNTDIHQTGERICPDQRIGHFNIGYTGPICATTVSGFGSPNFYIGTECWKVSSDSLLCPTAAPSTSTSPSLSPSTSSPPTTSTPPSLSLMPSYQPSSSSSPSLMPSVSSAPNPMPSGSPSVSMSPSGAPSSMPSESGAPSSMPSESGAPSSKPSKSPSKPPSSQPSLEPSATPSCMPSTYPTESPSTQFGVAMFYPRWEFGAEGCFIDGQEPEYMLVNPGEWLSTTLQKCCKKHFNNYYYDQCIGMHPPSAGNCAQMVYYPDWHGSNAGCVNDGGEPLYMLQNKDYFLSNSLRECCEKFYGWDLYICQGIEPVLTNGEFYPDWKWEGGRDYCTKDGQIPPYMLSNQKDYLTETLEECCDKHFWWKKKDCMDSVTTGTGKWYAVYGGLDTETCLQDCLTTGTNPLCGGLVPQWQDNDDELFASQEECCEKKLFWKSKKMCILNSRSG